MEPELSPLVGESQTMEFIDMQLLGPGSCGFPKMIIKVDMLEVQQTDNSCKEVTSEFSQEVYHSSRMRGCSFILPIKVPEFAVTLLPGMLILCPHTISPSILLPRGCVLVTTHANHCIREIDHYLSFLTFILLSV